MYYYKDENEFYIITKEERNDDTLTEITEEQYNAEMEEKQRLRRSKNDT